VGVDYVVFVGMGGLLLVFEVICVMVGKLFMVFDFSDFDYVWVVFGD